MSTHSSGLGWSLPAGCTTLPGEEPVPRCQVCGGDPEADPWEEWSCICHDCPVCGSVGDPRCYREHDMLLSTAQEIQKAKADQIEEQFREDEERQLQAEIEMNQPADWSKS